MAETAIAPRRMSLEEITKRVDIVKSSGWGLQSATGPQLQMLSLYCERHDLLPGDDATLYGGLPYITIDGRVKLMRRHPEYRGHSTRPLSKQEKMEWGYDPDDLVVEATIRHTSYGTIIARGKVSAAERNGKFIEGSRNNPVARQHPVEMAEKRALSRAERYAFGTDTFVDDEEVDDAVQTVIEQRTNPERVAANAAEYDRVFPSETVEVAPLPPQPAPAVMTRRSRDELKARYRELQPKAKELGVEIPPAPGADSANDEIEAWLADLEQRVRDAEQQVLDDIA